MLIAFLLTLITLGDTASYAGPGQLRIIAGMDPGAGGPATAARILEPWAVVTDSDGYVVFSDREGNRVYRIDGQGLLQVVAGTGSGGFNGKSQALEAWLSQPSGLDYDGAGNLYIADTRNQRVHKIDPDGVMSTVAGKGRSGVSGLDGPAVEASIGDPDDVAANAAGDIFILNRNDHSVYRVSGGTISRYAGNGSSGFDGDGGPAAEAMLSSPRSITVDENGTLYIADTSNRRIRAVSPSGTISTVVGNGEFDASGTDGPATEVGMYNPTGVVAAGGAVYIFDANRVRVLSDGTLSTAVDGESLLEPQGLTVSGSDLIIADTGHYRIVRASGGSLSVVAGGVTGDGGSALKARLFRPEDVAVAADGTVYIGDYSDHRIRRVDAAGTITTYAGTGILEFGEEAGIPAVEADLASPRGVTVSDEGLLFTDSGLVRLVTGSGMLADVAGGGDFGDDHPPLEVTLHSPIDVALGPGGDLYILENGSSSVRRVSGGVVSTVAGSGTHGFSGDGGPATAAQLNRPRGIVVDSSGTLYIADASNHRIRKVDASGTISTIAGNGTTFDSGDGGLATEASVYWPNDVTFDEDGNLLVAEFFGGRIRKVDLVTGIITTIAGGGSQTVTGTGDVATDVRLSGLGDVAVDTEGNVYFTDVSLRRVWMIEGPNAKRAADFDADGDVDFSDFVTFAGAFGSTPGDSRYDARFDIDGSGSVDFPDFIALAQDFGK